MPATAPETIPEFGIKRDQEERLDGGCAVVFDPDTGLFAVGQRDTGEGWFILFSGGVEDSENIIEGICREVTEESGLHNFAHIETLATAWTHYYHRIKNVNRVALATCVLIILKDTHTLPAQREAHENFYLVWKTAEEILASWQKHNQDQGFSHWLYFFEKALTRMKELGYQ